MGASKREEQVLKLVHPGRYVEIHREPITAAEVMRKYPRHSIARPDVFKFPYIVVRPESVLLPGSVFYIVPNITIHRLLKAREHQNQQAPPKNHGHRRNPKQVSPIKSLAGVTPMYLDDDDQHVLEQFQGKNRYMESPRHNPEKSLTRQSHVKSGPERIKRLLSSVVPREQDLEKDLPRQSHAKSLPRRTKSALSSACLVGITKNKNTHQEFDHANHVDSSMEISRSSRGREHRRFNRSNYTGQALPPNENGDLQNKNREQVVTLKSCLMKRDSLRRMQNFKVTFSMPMTTARSQAEYSQSF